MRLLLELLQRLAEVVLALKNETPLNARVLHVGLRTKKRPHALNNLLLSHVQVVEHHDCRGESSDSQTAENGAQRDFITGKERPRSRKRASRAPLGTDLSTRRYRLETGLAAVAAIEGG